MILKKQQVPILIFLVIAVIGFSLLFLSRQNFEFLIYVGVIIFFFGLILASNKKVKYSDTVLWGLAIWAVMHMAGGGVYLGETRLYELMLIPLSDNYPIFRYDQFVHIFGFAVATVVVYELLRPHLKEKITGWISLSIVIVMAGLGLGALNEIVEFTATLIALSTGVGGYVNTSLDLVANLIGAVIGLVLIKWKLRNGQVK